MTQPDYQQYFTRLEAIAKGNEYFWQGVPIFGLEMGQIMNKVRNEVTIGDIDERKEIVGDVELPDGVALSVVKLKPEALRRYWGYYSYQYRLTDLEGNERTVNTYPELTGSSSRNVLVEKRRISWSDGGMEIEVTNMRVYRKGRVPYCGVVMCTVATGSLRIGLGMFGGGNYSKWIQLGEISRDLRPSNDDVALMNGNWMKMGGDDQSLIEDVG